MGITPIVFSPPPENGTNLGRCLSRAEWFNIDLALCDFGVRDISYGTTIAYRFLDDIAEQHRVVWLDAMLCDELVCDTHYGKDFIYRDTGHLSVLGSIVLGKKFNFYKLIEIEI